MNTRTAVASVAGPVVGVAMGVVVGSVAFQVGGLGFAMVLVGCVIFTTAVALLVASFPSRGSPEAAARDHAVRSS